jgi:uncharacterized protein with ParB-like and HNH nuclease domain
MKGRAEHLLVFLEGARKRFIIPVYQRNYDWKNENCKQLFDDLVSVIKDGKSSHFFGSIVSYPHSREEIILIDGQQRITTVSLIMIAMINALKKRELITNDNTLLPRLEDYIVDKYDKTERKVRLKPFRYDCDAFDKLIYKEEKEFINDSIVTINYRYFYDRIVKYKELSADELFDAIDKLEVIDIELEPQHGDNPQLIFESLNSTGLDLSESDKIRNFVLMNLAPDVQEKYYDSYWNKIERCCKNELDGFVRNYLTIKQGVIPNLKSIYPSFKDFTKHKEIEPILQDMVKYAIAYQDIKTFSIGEPETNEIAKRLDLLDMTVAYPFLMAFISYAKETSMENDEIFSVLSCIETFIFRRLMCDLPTNALNKIFATLHSSVLKNKKEDDSYSSVMIYLLENRKLSSSFPKDEEFLNGFTSKNIYAMRAKNKEYIFERLENGSSKEKNDVVDNIEKGILTVEHIMPQTLSPSWKQSLGKDWSEIQERWLHTISNLTLSGYNYNYSNRPFQEKKNMTNGFLQSGLRLNHYIAQFDKWGEEELELRKGKLSKMALNIWSYPETNFIPEEKEEDVFFLSEDNSVPVGRLVQYFMFRGEKQNVGNWTEAMWEIVNKLLSINPKLLYQEASSKKNVWFEQTPVSKNYKKLAEGLYYCPSHSSTWNKMAILKNLFRLYGIDEDDLSFGLVSKKEVRAAHEVQDDVVDSQPRHELRKQFWAEFIKYSKENNGLFVKDVPVISQGISKIVKSPFGRIELNAVIGFNFSRMEVLFNTDDIELNKRLFDYVFNKKAVIENEYGKPLSWDRFPDKRISRIKDELMIPALESENKMEVFEFLKSASDKMYPIFQKYILEFADKGQ